MRRRRAREEQLAATDNKLFSLYSDGTNSLCIHIEWKCEEGIDEPADRWRAVQGHTGGVQGVVVLALRAPEVVREEKRVQAQLQAEAEEARRQAWQALMEEERRKRVEAATLVIQRCVRWTQNRKRHMKKWHGTAKVNIVERKEEEVEDCKRQLTRLKTSVYAAKGEIDHLERSVAAYRRQHQETVDELLDLDAQCSSLEKARRAAISGDYVCTCVRVCACVRVVCVCVCVAPHWKGPGAPPFQVTSRWLSKEGRKAIQVGRARLDIPTRIACLLPRWTCQTYRPITAPGKRKGRQPESVRTRRQDGGTRKPGGCEWSSSGVIPSGWSSKPEPRR